VRPVFPKAPYDQHEAHERDQSEDAAISRQPDPSDHVCAGVAKRDEYVRRQEDAEAKNENA
jgi:hypothetical protein